MGCSMDFYGNVLKFPWISMKFINLYENQMNSIDFHCMKWNCIDLQWKSIFSMEINRIPLTCQ